MTFRESTISVVDLLLWCGSGALVLFFATMTIRALWLGHVSINGKKATKLDEPAGYLLVLVAYLGCAYLFWLIFWDGLRTWLGLP